MWDIGRRSERPQLEAFLRQNAGEFSHLGAALPSGQCSADVFSPIRSQKYMLRAGHREALLAEQGVELLHFEQHLDEGVFIPGGCPHQVRNLTSCSKVSRDRIPP